MIRQIDSMLGDFGTNYEKGYLNEFPERVLESILYKVREFFEQKEEGGNNA